MQATIVYSTTLTRPAVAESVPECACRPYAIASISCSSYGFSIFLPGTPMGKALQNEDTPYKPAPCKSLEDHHVHCDFVCFGRFSPGKYAVISGARPHQAGPAVELCLWSSLSHQLSLPLHCFPETIDMHTQCRNSKLRVSYVSIHFTS